MLEIISNRASRKHHLVFQEYDSGLPKMPLQYVRVHIYTCIYMYIYTHTQFLQLFFYLYHFSTLKMDTNDDNYINYIIIQQTKCVHLKDFKYQAH